MENAKYTGFAVVELFGHVVERGYVTTLYFGNQAMFQIDTPGFPEREVVLSRGESFGSEWLLDGSRVVKGPVEPKSRIVGSGAVYAINPSTEQDVVGMVDGDGPIIRVIEKREPKDEDYPF